METAIALAEETGKGIATVQDDINGLAIFTDEGLQKASGMLGIVNGLLKEIDSTFDEPINLAYRAHKSMTGKKALHAGPLKQAKQILVGKIGTYTTERDAKIAEEKRLADEAREKAERDQREKDEAALQAAADAEKEGDTEKAAEIMETAAQEVPAPPPRYESKPAPKTAGMSVGVTWFANVVSKMDLCKAIVEGKVDPDCIEPNMKFLNAIAKAKKKTELGIAGVVGTTKPRVSGR